MHLLLSHELVALAALPTSTCPSCHRAVAEQLITRFGVPSITPDGQVTSHGTLQVCGCPG